MTCKHRATAFEHLARDVGDGIDMMYRRCCHCGSWLPLGPSNDSPAEVRVEMRAAEIAATRDSKEPEPDQPRDGWQFGWWLYNDEEVGMGDLDDGTDYTAGYLSYYPGWPCGWLARVIDTTKDETP